MANDNTQRRGVYLSPKLDEWFVDESKRTGKRINALMLEALEEYKNKHSNGGNTELEKEVRSIVKECLKESGGC